MEFGSLSCERQLPAKKLEIPISVLKDDSQCEFGKWLASQAMAQEVLVGHAKQVRTLHAEFHRVAAQVAELAVSGKQAAAECELAVDGSYGVASSKLTLALMSWKDSL